MIAATPEGDRTGHTALVLLSGQMADVAGAGDVAHGAGVSSRIPRGVPSRDKQQRTLQLCPAPHAQDRSVQEHKVLFFKCQVKPTPAKLCRGG